jgi:hypothetical protein
LVSFNIPFILTALPSSLLLLNSIVSAFHTEVLKSFPGQNSSSSLEEYVLSLLDSELIAKKWIERWG